MRERSASSEHLGSGLPGKRVKPDHGPPLEQQVPGVAIEPVAKKVCQEGESKIAHQLVGGEQPVCISVGCGKLLPWCAVRARYVRCADCRHHSKPLENDASDQLVQVVGDLPRKRPAPLRLASTYVSSSTPPTPTPPQLSDNPSVSRQGRVRMPARIFSPVQSPGLNRSRRFTFDVDEFGNVLEARRPKHELYKGSPRIAKVFSPRPDSAGDELIVAEGEKMYTERDEPRIYISPAPNWFCRPPAGVTESDLQQAIDDYNDVSCGVNASF